MGDAQRSGGAVAKGEERNKQSDATRSVEAGASQKGKGGTSRMAVAPRSGSLHPLVDVLF